MSGALNSALQADAHNAVMALRKINPRDLDLSLVGIRRCMLDRLDARHIPAVQLDDPFLMALHAAYANYWLSSLRKERSIEKNESALLAALNKAIEEAGGEGAAALNELEPTLESLVRARGYHLLLGVTSPLRELMLWKTEDTRSFDVALPDGMQPVTVVFMDDFASLGWAGFATCDRYHSGGWTKPERLYAVRDTYDLDSEDFHVSYLAHEGQHFADNRRFPQITAQDVLEYRAKLVQLAVGKLTAYDLLEQFALNTSDEIKIPHSYANKRQVRDLAARLFPHNASLPWRAATVENINAAAIALLREDTEQWEGKAQVNN
jgi:hypothetical protein